MGVLSLFLCIFLLVYLSFRGVSVLILGALLSMLMVFMSGDMPALYALTGPFMNTTAGYIGSFFPIFLTGAIFGKIMGSTGAAAVIAESISEKLGKERAILAVVLATGLLTYGGVSLFVVVFAVYPLAVALFQEADIPKRLMPGTIALGAITFSMTAMPGSPQSLNTMPTNALHTTIYAAPVLGIIATVIIIVLGVGWLNKRCQTAKANGEGYGEKEAACNLEDREKPSLLASVLPILLIFIVNWVLINIIFARPDYINEMNKFGGVNGTWAVTIALILAIALCLFLYRKQIPNINDLLTEGANSSLAPIFNTAIIVGFGGVVRVTSSFDLIKDYILNMNIPGLFKVGISTSLISGIVGSSSGGVGIALDALGNDFLSMGINPQAIHRVMLIAAGGLDSLPHCGAIVTLIAVCGMNHKKSYADIGMVTVIFPVISAIAIIIIYMMTGLV